MADTNSKPIYRIMDLHQADRPRERLCTLGPQSLSTRELRALRPDVPVVLITAWGSM